MKMTKEELKQALIEADERAAEVQEVINELANGEEDDELAMERIMRSGGDDMGTMLKLLQSKMGGQLLLQTMTVAVTAAAKTLAISKFMGVDPEMLKSLPKN